MEQVPQGELFPQETPQPEPTSSEEGTSLTQQLSDEEWEKLNEKTEDDHRTGNWK